MHLDQDYLHSHAFKNDLLEFVFGNVLGGAIGFVMDILFICIYQIKDKYNTFNQIQLQQIFF